MVDREVGAHCYTAEADCTGMEEADCHTEEADCHTEEADCTGTEGVHCYMAYKSHQLAVV